MIRNRAPLALAAALTLGLAACSPPPETPPIDDPPEPQATALRDAINEPLDKARAVEGSVQRAADAQRRVIDDAPAQAPIP